ncbi:hypothetical protein ACFLRH_01790, partial [Actinomycetota bacterium]
TERMIDTLRRPVLDSPYDPTPAYGALGPEATTGEIAPAVAELGATANDFVRTRELSADMSLWVEGGHDRCEKFEHVEPTSTFGGASETLPPDLLIELAAASLDC